MPCAQETGVCFMLIFSIKASHKSIALKIIPSTNSDTEFSSARSHKLQENKWSKNTSDGMRRNLSRWRKVKKSNVNDTKTWTKRAGQVELCILIKRKAVLNYCPDPTCSERRALCVHEHSVVHICGDSSLAVRLNNKQWAGSAHCCHSYGPLRNPCFMRMLMQGSLDLWTGSLLVALSSHGTMWDHAFRRSLAGIWTSLHPYFQSPYFQRKAPTAVLFYCPASNVMNSFVTLSSSA